MTLRLRVLTFLCLAGSLSAQTTESCTYDTCALRIERSRILRGVTGQRAGSLLIFSNPRLDLLVTPSDSALAHAMVFQRNFRSGMTMVFVGSVVGGIAGAVLIPTLAAYEEPSLLLTAGLVGGLSMQLVGAFRVQRALNAASRAIWWYNRDLPRDR